MFFLQIASNYKQRQIKTFSKAYRNDIEDLRASTKNPLMCKKQISARRTVFAPPISMKGSMTLEATLVLPFFMLFMLSLLSVIDMLRLHASTTWYLHQIGNELSLYSCLLGQEETEEDGLLDAMGDVGFSYIYIKERLEEKVEFPGESFFTNITILEEGKISLGFAFQYPLPFAIGGKDCIWLQCKFDSMSWQGEEASLDGQWAYATVSGEVYHLFADCTHINLSVQGIPLVNLEVVEEALGKKLEVCKLCAENKTDMAYITIQQGRYHFDEECGGLKRTIFVMNLENAKKKYKACQRCEERKNANE